jgi:hypothetical protein
VKSYIRDKSHLKKLLPAINFNSGTGKSSPTKNTNVTPAFLLPAEKVNGQFTTKHARKLYPAIANLRALGTAIFLIVL